MEVEPAHHRHHARIASHIPGRLRVKLGRDSRASQLLNGLKQHLEARGGIHAVNVDSASGSVTVHYDPGHYDTSGLLRLLEDCDLILQNLESMAEPSGLAQSTDFLATVEDLNARLHAATGAAIDLKLLLPLAFLGAGIWSIQKRGLMIEAVPGWLFLWLALDSFVKLHPLQRPEPA